MFEKIWDDFKKSPRSGIFARSKLEALPQYTGFQGEWEFEIFFLYGKIVLPGLKI